MSPAPQLPTAVKGAGCARVITRQDILTWKGVWAEGGCTGAVTPSVETRLPSFHSGWLRGGWSTKAAPWV